MKVQKRRIKQLKLALLLTLFVLSTVSFKVFAQLQTGTFSGNDPTSYQCIANGQITTEAPTKDATGNIICNNGVAVLKPPALQQIEVWFVRILYTIWALVGSLSFLLLVKLGYEYTISRGDVTKITEIRKKIIYYIVGFALVFLAVPVLSTVFNLLGINTSVQCYNVNMPGFQFFFTTLCTDPRGITGANVVSNPCNFQTGSQGVSGLICSQSDADNGTSASCGGNSFYAITYYCEKNGGSVGVWCYVETINSQPRQTTDTCKSH